MKPLGLQVLVILLVALSTMGLVYQNGPLCSCTVASVGWSTNEDCSQRAINDNSLCDGAALGNPCYMYGSVTAYRCTASGTDACVEITSPAMLPHHSSDTEVPRDVGGYPPCNGSTSTIVVSFRTLWITNPPPDRCDGDLNASWSKTYRCDPDL